MFFFVSPAEAFIVSKSDSELFEVYAILSENLYHVSSALNNMEINMKSYTQTHGSACSHAFSSRGAGTGGGGGGGGESSDIVTNL